MTPTRRADRSGRGFALIELLVAAAVLLLVLALAADLLRESQVLLRNLALEHRDPLPGLALITLRRDLELGRSADQVAGILTIHRAGGLVTYNVERGCLQRALFDANGDLLGERCMYDRTLSILLTRTGASYAEVELRVLVREAPRPTRAVGDPRGLPAQEPRVLTVAANLRAATPKGSW